MFDGCFLDLVCHVTEITAWNVGIHSNYGCNSVYLTVTPKAIVLASWKCTVSKVISLKMKTLISAVVCTYLMWGPHREMTHWGSWSSRSDVGGTARDFYGNSLR